MNEKIQGTLVVWQQVRGGAGDKVLFRDPDGKTLASHEVVLEEYLVAHDGGQEWAKVHRTVIAKAALHGVEVPEDVVKSHEVVLLAEANLTEKRLHGAFPSPWCRMCQEMQAREA